MLAFERADAIVTATLSRPPVNALDGELIGALAEIDGTRPLYAHAETRRRVAAFLDRSAARATKGAPR